jgi:hypothetical protein
MTCSCSQLFSQSEINTCVDMCCWSIQHNIIEIVIRDRFLEWPNQVLSSRISFLGVGIVAPSVRPSYINPSNRVENREQV